jgi:hypothetical protein
MLEVADVLRAYGRAYLEMFQDTMPPVIAGHLTTSSTPARRGWEATSTPATLADISSTPITPARIATAPNATDDSKSRPEQITHFDTSFGVNNSKASR